MKIVNMTPHSVNLFIDGEYVEFSPCGVVPRISVTSKLINGDFPFHAVKEDYGDVVDLPDEEEGTILIVSKMCADARPHRKDLWYPTDLVRDESGRITGCDSLGCLAF